MKVFILCAVILLTCTNIFAYDDFSHAENELDSKSNESEVLADNDETGANNSQMFASEDNEDANVIKGYNNDDDVDEGGLMVEDDDSAEVEMDQSMIEKVYGIELPVCGAFAELDYPLHVSHLTDCNKFYKCANGRGYLFDCPSGEHWSVKLDRCEYPESAGCVADGRFHYKLRKVSVQQASVVENESNDDFEIDPRCEGGDPFKPLHFQHPNDCKKFYKCFMGKAYVIKCPKGQHFSQKLDRCEHPALAKCTAIKPAALIMPAAEEEEEKKHTIADDPDYIIYDARCNKRETDLYHPIQFPHPTECKMFYKCVFGRAYKQECPWFLHYSSEMEGCDYPWSANCVIEDSVQPAAASLDIVEVPSIPDCSHGRTVKYALQGSPKSYFTCMNGQAYFSNCDAKEFFNPSTLQCESQQQTDGDHSVYGPNYQNYYPMWNNFQNWPQYPNFGMNQQHGSDKHESVPQAPNEPAVPQVPVAPQNPDFPSWLPQPNPDVRFPQYPINKISPDDIIKDTFDFSRGKTSARCPTADDPLNPTHLSHETDCNKFYKCFNQKAFLLECPPGQEFSEELARCDYHMFANCDPVELIKRKIQN